MSTKPQNQEPGDDELRQIERLDDVTLADIRELKARQWDVTKWVLAANVALLVPIAIRRDPANLPPGIVIAIVIISIVLAVLGCATILKTQGSLQRARQRRVNWRHKHPAMNAAYEHGGEKLGQASFWYDTALWLPMLLITIAASAGAIAVAVGSFWLAGAAA